MSPARQLSLELRTPRRFVRSDFIVSGSNAEATALIDAWPKWPAARLALVGPPGSGKSHLAWSWAERVGATVVGGDEIDASSLTATHVLVEDIDAVPAGEGLFRLLESGAPEGLLLTARTPPLAWPVALADLRSRVNALVLAPLAAPDDAVLSAMLSSLFRERNIRPAEDVIPYLLARMERSGAAARALVARIDEVSGAEGSGVTRPLVRKVLEDGACSLDLFA